MNRRSGFTLIELLVVIAIIAILAAILFPVFAQAKAAAKSIAAVSNIKQLGTANHIYSADYDDMTPMYEYTGPDGVAWYYGRIIHPYTKNAEILWDPATGVAVSGGLETTGDWGMGASDNAWQLWHNLSLNGPGMFGFWVSDPGGSYYSYGRNMSAQENIAERCMMMTTADPRSNGPHGYYQFLNYTAYNPNYADSTDFWANLTIAASKRHRDGNVVVFADSHAARVPSKKIHTPEGGNATDFYNSPGVSEFWGYWWSASE